MHWLEKKKKKKRKEKRACQSEPESKTEHQSPGEEAPPGGRACDQGETCWWQKLRQMFQETIYLGLREAAGFVKYTEMCFRTDYADARHEHTSVILQVKNCKINALWHADEQRGSYNIKGCFHVFSALSGHPALAFSFWVLSVSDFYEQWGLNASVV